MRWLALGLIYSQLAFAEFYPSPTPDPSDRQCDSRSAQCMSELHACRGACLDQTRGSSAADIDASPQAQCLYNCSVPYTACMDPVLRDCGTRCVPNDNDPNCPAYDL